MSVLQYKWKCSGCNRDLRVTFTRKDGRQSRLKRIMIGTVSVAVSVHIKACSDQGLFATFCAECAQAGLLEQFVEARRLLVAPDAPGAMAAEGRKEPPPASIPCRGCAAMFVWVDHRNSHERYAHPGLNPAETGALLLAGGES